MKFEVLIATVPGYSHTEAFAEVAESIHYGLIALGHESKLSRGLHPTLGSQAIVLGAHVLANLGVHPPEGSILYNLEQIEVGSRWTTPEYLEMLKHYPAWDYSPRNIDALVSMGVKAPTLVPISSAPELFRIDPVEKDIDVLFYGSLLERRDAVLQELERRKLHVQRLYGTYGAQRDGFIARSKIVINMHAYEAKVFEAVRVSYLLCNGATVVSETGSSTQEEAEYQEAVKFSSYEGLVDTCVSLLQRPEERERLSRAGRTLMRTKNIAVVLEPIVNKMKEVVPTYYEHRRTEVVDRIDVSGMKILDVGCAAGAMGALMLERGAESVVGIESEPRAVALARTRLTAIHCLDLEEEWAIPYPAHHFDVVTCADVLEHLRDPAMTLQVLKRYLRPEGKIVVSIPNVRNASVVLPLLFEGKFDYQDAGILDRTHLRFFTLSSFIELLAKNGFEIEPPIAAVNMSMGSGTEKVVAALKSLALQMGKDAESLEAELRAVQYIIAAKKVHT